MAQSPLSQFLERMEKELSEYIFLDGMWLQEKQLLKLAMNVGNFALAEHYLCALLADAVIKGRREVIVEVNKVREHYGVNAIPLGKDDLQEDDNLQGKTRLTAADEQAKRLFLKMTEEERLEVLRKCMHRLIKGHLYGGERPSYGREPEPVELLDTSQ